MSLLIADLCRLWMLDWLGLLVVAHSWQDMLFLSINSVIEAVFTSHLLQIMPFGLHIFACVKLPAFVQTCGWLGGCTGSPQ